MFKFFPFAELDLTNPAISTETTTVSPIYSAVKMFLDPLSKLELRELGLELGLRWHCLKNIMKKDCILDDILDSWLREDDDVTETSGHPSWLSLVKALEEVGTSQEVEEQV